MRYSCASEKKKGKRPPCFLGTGKCHQLQNPCTIPGNKYHLCTVTMEPLCLALWRTKKIKDGLL